MKPTAQLALAIIATVVVGLMSFTAYRAEFLTDHVRQLISIPMTTTKITQWYCSVHNDWETVITTGSDAETVCRQHAETVRKEKATHIPGPPPPGASPPPAPRGQ